MFTIIDPPKQVLTSPTHNVSPIAELGTAHIISPDKQ